MNYINGWQNIPIETNNITKSLVCKICSLVLIFDLLHPKQRGVFTWQPLQRVLCPRHYLSHHLLLNKMMETIDRYIHV